jgi:hypothetical protein
MFGVLKMTRAGFKEKLRDQARAWLSQDEAFLASQHRAKDVSMPAAYWHWNTHPKTCRRSILDDEQMTSVVNFLWSSFEKGEPATIVEACRFIREEFGIEMIPNTL